MITHLKIVFIYGYVYKIFCVHIQFMYNYFWNDVLLETR